MAILGKPAEWLARATKMNVRDKGLGDLARLSSASEISDAQFLALRVLWELRDSEEFEKKENEFIPDEYLERAADFLKNFPAWRGYIKYLEQRVGDGKGSDSPRVPNLGTFSLVESFQLQVAGIATDEPASSRVTFTPVAHRLRSSARPTTPDSPTPAGRGGFVDMSDMRKDLPSFDDSPSFYPESAFKPGGESPDSRPIALLPPTPDEQIVNTALILLLDALTVHFCGLTHYWTIHRYAFIVNCGEKNFEARTDGYLKDKKSGKVGAIVEVKPNRREKDAGKVRLQESAQMVGWVANGAPKWSAEFKGRHLLISQDRDEIYLTFAQFDEAYRDYVMQKRPPTDPPSFMKMREYGPWKTKNTKDMAHLSRFLLAFTLWVNDDA
ncbi:hypothetical protein FQN54_001237 [Arachnomyces sp. PD_36]|nr:hypothetical protein FQN54_001237 [Arachnomyces sp. PD_36]